MEIWANPSFTSCNFCTKTIHELWILCSHLDTTGPEEHNKIGFKLFGAIFYFLWILQVPPIFWKVHKYYENAIGRVSLSSRQSWLPELGGALLERTFRRVLGSGSAPQRRGGRGGVPFMGAKRRGNSPELAGHGELQRRNKVDGAATEQSLAWSSSSSMSTTGGWNACVCRWFRRRSPAGG